MLIIREDVMMKDLMNLRPDEIGQMPECAAEYTPNVDYLCTTQLLVTLYNTPIPHSLADWANLGNISPNRCAAIIHIMYRDGWIEQVDNKDSWQFITRDVSKEQLGKIHEQIMKKLPEYGY